MLDTSSREHAKSLFDRNQKREAEIADALQQEKARRAAILENMNRLRELRLAQNAKSQSDKVRGGQSAASESEILRAHHPGPNRDWASNVVYGRFYHSRRRINGGKADSAPGLRKS